MEGACCVCVVYGRIKSNQSSSDGTSRFRWNVDNSKLIFEQQVRGSAASQTPSGGFGEKATGSSWRSVTAPSSGHTQRPPLILFVLHSLLLKQDSIALIRVYIFVLEAESSGCLLNCVPSETSSSTGLFRRLLSPLPPLPSGEAALCARLSRRKQSVEKKSSPNSQRIVWIFICLHPAVCIQCFVFFKRSASF